MRISPSVLAVSLSAVLVCPLATAQLAKPPLTIRVASPFPSGHIMVDTALRFKQELEKRARHIVVDVQAGVLNEQTIDPAAKPCKREDRIADILFTGGQPLQDYAPKYFFFNGPYVIRDFKHLRAVWNSDLGNAMRKTMEMNGNYVVFDPVYRGFRQFTSNKPIAGPADFAGLKLRLPPTPDWVAVWSALGAVPVTVPLTGIYDALKNGTAEASEGDLTQIQSLKLYEVQSRLTLTSHLVGFGMPMANACFLRQELTAGDRAKVKEAMKQAIRWGSDTMKNKESTVQAQLAAAGMTVTTPDTAAIRQAATPAIEQLFATKWTVTTWQEVLSKK